MPETVLLIASEPAATSVAQSLRQQLDLAVDVVAHRRAAMSHLRRRQYTLLLLEENLAAVDEEATSLLYDSANTAPVLEINFAVTSAPRVVRQVRSALQRRAHDRQQARAAVATSLHQELNASLTGLLLESQLALRAATPEQAPKLRHVVELANDLRERLRA